MRAVKKQLAFARANRDPSKDPPSFAANSTINKSIEQQKSSIKVTTVRTSQEPNAFCLRGQLLLADLPSSLLLPVCQYLSKTDIRNLSITARIFQNKFKDPVFDPMWTLISYQTHHTKSGL